ncbi:hypothetical protein CJ030_MR2G025682 [Morella rubra]|uniref:Uncharacterized protein n=1 Tax=Morella rubra TaxID=262757 RepID=A0A6A1WDY2_9ROSI|nr:hypothetical protein CJ030_MR2G025682 [Morella rubra]
MEKGFRGCHTLSTLEARSCTMSHEIWTASHSLSWKAICIEYGYTHGDLMYYAHPAKSLDDGLVLISSNMDLLEMVTCHKGHNTIILYVVAFGDEAGHDQENRKSVHEIEWCLLVKILGYEVGEKVKIVYGSWFQLWPLITQALCVEIKSSPESRFPSKLRGSMSLQVALNLLLQIFNHLLHAEILLLQAFNLLLQAFNVLLVDI